MTAWAWFILGAIPVLAIVHYLEQIRNELRQIKGELVQANNRAGALKRG